MMRVRVKVLSLDDEEGEKRQLEDNQQLHQKKSYRRKIQGQEYHEER